MSEEISGLFKIKLPMFPDERGFFSVLSCGDWQTLPIFLQSNLSYSHEGVVRGLHFQHPYPQGKLVTVIEGAVDDFILDLRPDSPTFKRFMTIPLEAKGASLYVPEGCAHGFLAKKPTLLHYSCTRLYVPDFDKGINIRSVTDLIDDSHVMSDKDKALPSLSDYLASLDKG